MIRDALEFILGLGEPEIVEVEGRNYTPKELRPIREPQPVALNFSTLTGLVDFATDLFDANSNNNMRPSELAFHVVDHSRVNLITKLYGKFQQRDVLATASLANHGDGFLFGLELEAEKFVIGLQSNFVRTPELAEVLSCAGNMRAERHLQSQDDGVTQVVTSAAGVHLATTRKVPNPVILQPYRTFREIEQPASEFVFRVNQKREGELPRCALYEADGGKWKLVAISRIAGWLQECKTGITVLA